MADTFAVHVTLRGLHVNSYTKTFIFASQRRKVEVLNIYLVRTDQQDGQSMDFSAVIHFYVAFEASLIFVSEQGR